MMSFTANGTPCSGPSGAVLRAAPPCRHRARPQCAASAPTCAKALIDGSRSAMRARHARTRSSLESSPLAMRAAASRALSSFSRMAAPHVHGDEGFERGRDIVRKLAARPHPSRQTARRRALLLADRRAPALSSMPAAAAARRDRAGACLSTRAPSRAGRPPRRRAHPRSGGRQAARSAAGPSFEKPLHTEIAGWPDMLNTAIADSPVNALMPARSA